MNKNYTEDYCVKLINRKFTAEVNTVDKIIYVLRGTNEIGRKSWGKIDYLVNYCRYKVIFVDSISKSKKYVKYVEEIDDTETNKSYKKEKKYNMANVTKKIMSKVKLH